FLGFAALLIFTGACFAAITKDAVLDENKLTLSRDEISVFDCADAAVKTTALGDKKLFFPVEKIPEKVKFAFIDAEDKHFYTHGGTDFLRMARAALNNLRARSFKEGASTISQQLIKNTHLTQEKTIKRKLLELKLTGELESRYTKDEILEKYLNSIYFGHNCFGIKSAAEFYFSKSPDELTLSEGAALAGIVKSPNNYSPFKNPEKCKARRSAALAAMLKRKHITAQEKTAAENAPLPQKSARISADESYLARCYDELEKIADEKTLFLKGKISIYTYLDCALQNALSSVSVNFSEEKSDVTAAVLNNDSCGFSAYFSTCGNIERSPASLFKPLCAYAPAFEEKLLTPATPVSDAPARFNGYEPKNYGDRYYGYVSARECIAKSLNVPAVKTLNALTVEKSRKYLSNLGLSTDKNDFSLAAALGGVKKGYTLPQLISAYSVFPRGGLYRPARFIRKIVIDGQCVYDAETEAEKEKRVFSESTAALITDVLKTCAKEGTAKKLRALPFE
ncbi:MAG: transglycosylase domain-containing protein, partial [Candidatus Scatosoma sp.]